MMKVVLFEHMHCVADRIIGFDGHQCCLHTLLHDHWNFLTSSLNPGKRTHSFMKHILLLSLLHHGVQHISHKRVSALLAIVMNL